LLTGQSGGGSGAGGLGGLAGGSSPGDPNDPNNWRNNRDFSDSIGTIANRLGVTTREANDAIHLVKRSIPRGSPHRNPDVVVNTTTGEVFPKTPGGGLGDSIGNIFNFLP